MTAIAPPPFLKRYLPPASDRPFITLTWAQSLDSKIAGKDGARILISGPETMLMTHWYVVSASASVIIYPRPYARGVQLPSGHYKQLSPLKVVAEIRMRTMHDAILVGINTIVLDDPRLKSESTSRST
jgi:2,5-diamino-6-(ribosylamino)-4(3H)-pyrimidinone 5'-phosphate reductase